MSEYSDKMYWVADGKYHHKFFKSYPDWTAFLDELVGSYAPDFQAYVVDVSKGKEGYWYKSELKPTVNERGEDYERACFYRHTEELPQWLKTYMLLIR